MLSLTPSTKPKRPVRVVRIAVFLVIAFTLVLATLVSMMAVTSILSPLSQDPNAPTVVVVVHRGATDRQIGELLMEKQVIRKAVGFTLGARLEHVNGKMVAGTYEVSPAMTPRAIAVMMALGRTAEDFVTIPEGFTVRRIAARLAARHMADEHRLLDLAINQGRSFRIGKTAAPDKNLEGYLFPDTYRIPKGTTERGILQMMLTEFASRVLPLDNQYLAKHPDKLSGVVKMASLVEREAEVDGDRPKIASALENRLRRGMKLECDATIEYALPVYKKRLFYKDLKVDSAYNTYLHGGLPPTPIASPGIPSIEAAIHPAVSGYLYYVARPDGTHIFSDTLDAHNRAVAEVRALRPKT